MISNDFPDRDGSFFHGFDGLHPGMIYCSMVGDQWSQKNKRRKKGSQINSVILG